MSLDELLDAEVVYAASRHVQTLRQAPSAVSVVTAAEIREHGYRTLADVLRSLPSFYVTEDRHYSYIGVRGYGQPGDFGARVLLLLNGLRTNDDVYEQAYVGQEFILDTDLIERIEVVRGPSAAIYGSSAFFAVVNVVSRRGRDFEGGEVSAQAASFGAQGGRATYGRRLAGGLELLFSASILESDGQRLYFKEFDTPETANGIADRVDGERVFRGLVNVSKGAFSFEANFVSREKGVPTGAFGTLFGDPRTRSRDRKQLVSLTWARSLSDRSSVMARVHYGFADSHGTYVLAESRDLLDDDSARGQWYGVEANVVRPVGARQVVTAGVDFQDDFDQQQMNFIVSPHIVYQDSHNSSDRVAVFAQDEITLAKRFTLHAGVREDWYDEFGYQTSPRLALVYGDGKGTALKLLHGRAFRAPNDYERHFTGPVSKVNPDLGLETIRTTELVLERTVRPGLLLNASLYANAIDDLVRLELDPTDGLYIFRNAGQSDARGIEIGIDVKRRQGPSGRLSYAWQRSRDHDTREPLTNSPHHTAKGGIVWPFFAKRLTASLDAWYLSRRLTLAGAESGSSTVANATLQTARLRGRFELSASVYNLFDAHYSDPGSTEHIQDLIAQDGRNFRLKLSCRF